MSLVPIPRVIALTLAFSCAVGGIDARAATARSSSPPPSERNPDLERERQEREELRPQSRVSGRKKTDAPLFEFRNRLILEGMSEYNLDLERGDDIEKAHELEPQWRFSALIGRDRPIWGYLETELLHKTERETGERQQHRNLLRVNHAYVAFDDLLPDSELRIGRWLYRDEREWLFDENFDGVHLDTERNDLQLELFGARVSHWQRDLFDSSSKGPPVNHWAGLLRYQVEDDWKLGAYAVTQHDTRDGDHLRFVGLRSHRTPKKKQRHWLELGHVRGRQDGRRISGNVIDAGITHVFGDARLRPRLTFGYVRAGGGLDSAGRPRGYRQTGLQSNEATHGGLAKFKLYGEALDPELRNLQIATVGLGLRLNRNLSVDLIRHRYWQPQIATLEAAEIRPRGDTLDGRKLGTETDLIIGWRPVRDLTLDFAFGHFRPNARLRDSRDLTQARRGKPATTARIKFNWKF